MNIDLAAQRFGHAVAGALGRDSLTVRILRPAYELLLDWMTAGRGIHWTINDEQYRIDPRFRRQLGSNYETPIAALLRERVRPGSVCIDVGANVGVYALQFARWSGPSGRVVAFEPNPTARVALERHLRLNGLVDKVRVMAEAVTDRSGKETLYVAEADGMSKLDVPNEAIADRAVPISVSSTTLDEFCERESLSPDWLMIDIEGLEIEALRGAVRVVRNGRPGLGIIVELHPSAWKARGHTRAEVDEIFAALGVRPIALTGQTDPLLDYGIVELAYV